MSNACMETVKTQMRTQTDAQTQTQRVHGDAALERDYIDIFRFFSNALYIRNDKTHKVLDGLARFEFPKEILI